MGEGLTLPTNYMSSTYSPDVILDHPRYRHRMLCILLCNDREIADLVSRIYTQILERVFVVFSHLV